MNPVESSKPQWGASYRLIAVEKWKMKSAAMGRAATDALVEYARPQQGMHVLDLASGTGEPGISLAGADCLRYLTLQIVLSHASLVGSH